MKVSSNKVVFCILCAFLFFSSVEAKAGGLVFDSKELTIKSQPIRKTYFFSTSEPDSDFWLQVTNGSYGKSLNLVDSAIIKVNGKQIVGPKDFAEETFGLSKDVKLQANNEVYIELEGKEGSSLSVQIRFADRDMAIENEDRDLWISRMKEIVGIWWGEAENAKEYAMFRSYSSDGPWQELARIPLTKGVDIPSEEKNAGYTLCYKIEAFSAENELIRIYDPVCASW